MAVEPSSETIFARAIEIESSQERLAYLEQACAEPAARHEIEKLVSDHFRAGSFLESPAAAQGVTVDLPQFAEQPGAQIGPYKLLQQIGEGGMGTVFMAEQTEPVKRKVALKVIKAGMDSRQVIARFEAERQALAMMDHVNIARVFDGGATENGRPYFVMELVHGVPITKYCDDNHLTPRQRLELFVPVCQAIQHAHQKGIIHRDVKPSNVMVTLYDGKPVPKVIDFGVAKATEQNLTERTLFTQYGTMIGTLEYMSPEQAEMSALGVDTRSDIYSLGVLLYELLTGSTPLTHKRMKEAAYGEILRMIKEEEPPKPSTRLSDSGEALASISAQRKTEPAKLSKLMRGELDWIVMKTLEKDRNRRYETAKDFAADVQRYLSDEPVQACPPSALYRFRKYARRNKRILATAGVIGLALVLGTIISMWQAVRATQAEGLAEKRLETANANYQMAEEQRQRAEGSELEAKTNEGLAKDAQKQSVESLKDALAAVDQMTRVAEDRLANVPQMEPIRRDLLLDALKFYQKFLDKQSDDPVIRREAAFAHRRVGRIHHQLGQYQDAERAYRNAFEMFDKLDPSAFAAPALLQEMVNCHIEFSWTLGALGKAEETRQNIRRAAELANKLDKQTPGNRSCILNARNVLASILLSEKPDEAEKILKENLALADDAFSLGAVHRGLGAVFMFTGRLPQAEESARLALKYAEQMSAEHPSSNWVQAALANDQRTLAGVILNQRPEEAEEIRRRAVLILDKLATDFPNGPANRGNLADALIEHAGLLKQLGRPAEAEKAYRRALDLTKRLAEEFPSTPVYKVIVRDAREALISVSLDLGKKDEVVRLIDEFVPSTVEGYLARAKLNRTAGLVDRANADFEQAMKIEPRTAADYFERGERNHAFERHKNALADFQKAAELDPDTWVYHHKLVWIYCWGRHPGLRDLQRGLQHAKRFVELVPEKAVAWHALGSAYHALGDQQKAIENITRAIEMAPKENADYWVNRGIAYRALGQFDKALADFDEADRLSPTANCRAERAKVYLVKGEYEKAVAEYDSAESLGQLPYHHYNRRGRAHFHLKNFDKALADITKGMELNWNDHSGLTWISPAAVAACPDENFRKGIFELADRTIEKTDRKASAFAVRARLNAAHKKYSEAAADYTKAIELDPKNAVAYNNLAWLLATADDAKFRDPKRALELAKKAVELEPKNGFYWQTLGVAQYRAADWRGAIAALEKVKELGSPGESMEWFPLAMAHWQLGDKEQARKHYDQAIAWMDKNAPQDEELRRFRAEAAELLSIEKKK